MASPASVLQRLRRALATPPTRAHLRPFAVEAAWVLPMLLALGLAGGWMQWRPVFDADVLRLAAFAIVAPAIGEELLFRAALLPQPEPGRKLPLRHVALSTLLFVAWHPLQVFVFGPHWARIVLDPWFLAATAALGVALARLYWRTGSLWPPVALHWLAVVGWKALLGGPSPWTAT